MAKVWFVHTRGRYPDFRVEARNGREARAAFRKLHGLRVMPSNVVYDESSWARAQCEGSQKCPA